MMMPMLALGNSILAVILAILIFIMPGNAIIPGAAILVTAVTVMLCALILYGLIKKLSALMQFRLRGVWFSRRVRPKVL